MPSHYDYPASSSARPIPVPSGYAAEASSYHSRHPASIPSPSSSASLDGPLVHKSPTSPPLSRPARRSSNSHSHSLAGSYTLSLLSSRMSHAHPGRSVSSAFRLQIGCSSSGKDVPARLRCPDHIRVGFDATCYDLDDGNGGASGAVSTPWVGCVDLQAHYHGACEEGPRGVHSVPPPRYPGYQVPAHGLLQLVVANAHHALRVFLVPYDLASLEPGGRMLVRERGYEAVSSQPGSPYGRSADRRTSFGAAVTTESKREVLRWAVEMQFACVLEEVERKPRRDGSRTRREAPVDQARRRERSTRSDTRRDGRDTPMQRLRSASDFIKQSKPKLVRAYYLTKAVRMVFPSLSEPQGPPSASSKQGQASSSGRCTPTPRADAPIRTERFVEVMNPSPDGVDTGGDQSKARKNSFAAETWEGLRTEWRRRLLEEAKAAEVLDDQAAQESRRGAGPDRSARNSASPEQRQQDMSPTADRRSFERARPQHAFQSERIPIQPRPVQASSLLSVRLGSLPTSTSGRSLTPIPASDDFGGTSTRDPSPRPARDPYEGLDADGVPLPAHERRHGSRGTISDREEEERLQQLSHQLEQLSSPSGPNSTGILGQHASRL